MAGGWRRTTDEFKATFRVEGCLDQGELESLSRELVDAADAGCHHLVLDLQGSCEQSLSHWWSFRPVLDTITLCGARLSVQGAAPDLEAGLESAAVEAQLRMLDRKYPDFFRKQPA
ncbi:hypothetical protein JST97_12610 [bacterium]|nr:hypothetical protein [bacterium]